MGGRVVFFCHDSDHDPRETRTILRHRATGEPAQLNFAVATKLQRKFSPLYVKRIAPDWHGKTLRQLPNYVDGRLIDLFRKTSAETVADFCLEMYRGMALARWDSRRALERSGVAAQRMRGERFLRGRAVRGRDRPRARARRRALPARGRRVVRHRCRRPPSRREQISPTRDTRLRWMQSVIRLHALRDRRGRTGLSPPG